MKSWRILGALVILGSLGVRVQAQTYPLTETIKAGDCYQLDLDMRLAGEMRVFVDGKMTPMKLAANAQHSFHERVLQTTAAGIPEKVARHYQKASCIIGVQRERKETTLRADRQLIVTQRHSDQALTYCPTNALNRDELELVGDHFETLNLSGLLPGKDVSIGDKWKPSNSVVQALCHFEGLTEHSLEAKLAEVQGQTATVKLEGAATGIETGALVKLKIDATCTFDLATKHLVKVEWKQKDDRDQGPVSPAETVDMTVTITRKACDQPATLSDIALVAVPDGFEPPPPVTQLELRDSKSRFDLLHSRDWQTVSISDDHVVMRLMERGDFIAQVTISPWTSAEKGQHMTPDEFKDAMSQTPGWTPEEELQAGEVPTEGGKWVYRLSVLGQLDGQKTMQNFYLVASPNGEQVVLAFTLLPKQANRLGTRDITLAANVDFPKSRKDK